MARRRPADLKDRRSWTVNAGMIAQETRQNPRKVRADVNEGKVRPWDLGSLVDYVWGYKLVSRAEKGA